MNRLLFRETIGQKTLSMYPFRSSAFADEDIIDILAYTLMKWGLEQHHRYKALLDRGRTEIRENPFRPGSKSREDLATDCRIYRVEHLYFIYRVRNETIEIARVLHENMDFDLQVREAYFPA